MVKLMKTTITQLHTRSIWDSRGRPTIEAEVALACGVTGRAAAPAGASRGDHEAVDLRDGGSILGGMGVGSALGFANGEVRDRLLGVDATDQPAVDALLSEIDGTSNFARIGGNGAVAVSLAVLHAAAAAEGLPLWQYLAAGNDVRLPLPEIQIFGGGAHAGRRTDVQDYMIMAPHAGSIRHALEMTAEVYRAAGEAMAEQGLLTGTADEGGWWPNFSSNEHALSMLVHAIERAGFRPGEDIYISLDLAANELRHGPGYRLPLDGAEPDSTQMVARVADWCRRFPILSIEDPVGQDDVEGMQQATALLGETVQVIGDDFLVTNAARVAAAQASGACNALLVKVNQAGTVTAAKAALDEARSAGWATIVSARSGETEDVSIAHLATGWDAGQIKVGSFARSERMAKWNELLRIEEAMASGACFAGPTGLPSAVGDRIAR